MVVLYYFDFFDVWGVEGEDLFDVYVVGDFVYCEGWVCVIVVLFDDYIFEDLYLFFVVFFDYCVDLYVVVGMNVW